MIATSTNSGAATTIEEPQPLSRTYQYRKVMKPMLERKRRARINRCLDELKELMVTALQSEGENVSKLEKADILELTVRHLHKLRRQKRLASNPVIEADRFRAGYTQCAQEVSRCLACTPGMDIDLGKRLMTHLGKRLVEINSRTPLVINVNNNNNNTNHQHHHQQQQHHHHPYQHQHYTPPGSPSLDDSIALGTTSTTAFTLPLTPASSPSSFSTSSMTRHNTPSPAPQPIDCSTTTGLLKVADVTTQDHTREDEKVWRPW